MARLEAAEAKIAEQAGTIEELRARLNQNSQNSSKPPSSDLPGTRPPKPKRGKRKKRGGQPGHVGRFAADPERVDEVKQYRAKVCKHCAADLTKGAPTGSVISHYVYELPEIRPIVTDHQCLDVRCASCGMVTPGELPPEVPAGQYGPTVQAMTALVRGDLRQSVRQTSEVMTRVLHVPMSTGMVAKTQEQVSRVLAAPHAEAIGHLQRSDRAHADETSWRMDKAKAWLWVGVTTLVIAFIIHRRRSKQAAKELLGAGFGGILICDRWASYNWIDAARRQMCWSHLKRDFKSFLEYGNEAKRLGEQLLAERKKLFRLWNRVRDGTMTRAEFQLACRPIRRRIEALLEEGTRLSSAKVSGMCREILKQRPALFTFVEFEGVEPTNNAAERAIRFAVLMRKGCFGSDSARGARFIERFLTVRGTLRLHKRDLYEYLRAACTAALHGLPAPSLLPESAAYTGQAAAAA
jgi:transposase